MNKHKSASSLRQKNDVKRGELKAQRQARVCQLYLKSYSQARIAEIVGVSINTVNTDIKEIRALWLKTAVTALSERKALELARIDHLESMAWLGFERSLEKQKLKHRKVEYGIEYASEEKGATSGKGKTLSGATNDKQSKGIPNKPNKVSKDSREHRLEGKAYKGLIPQRLVKEVKEVCATGDTKYLDIVAKCIEMRAKICGLFKDVGGSPTMNVVNIPWAQILNSGPSLPHNSTTPLQPGSEPPRLEDRSQGIIGGSVGANQDGEGSEVLVELDNGVKVIDKLAGKPKTTNVKDKAPRQHSNYDVDSDDCPIERIIAEVKGKP